MSKENNQQSGFFLIDKPEDCSTFDLIREVRSKTPFRKIGHTGTLDPFASGLVVLCVNKATKLSSYILNSEKEYLVKMELGIKTDSGDREGSVIEQQEIQHIDDRDIIDAVKKVLQIEKQTPPSYSAVKVNGKPSYKYAREGKMVSLSPRTIKIFSLDIVEVTTDSITYKTKVSKGTYIRSLSESFAGFLGTVAYTSELRRTSIGEISVDEAVRPELITSENWQQYLKPIKALLGDSLKAYLNNDEAVIFKNGNPLQLDKLHCQLSLPEHILSDLNNNLLLAYSTDTGCGKEECLGIAVIKNGFLCPKKVF